MQALETALFSDSLRAELPWAHAIMRYWPVKRIRDMLHSDGYILEYGKMAIANAPTQGHGPSNLFANIFAEAEEKERSELKDSDVHWEAMGLIVAGSDTTAVTLTYLIWAVLKRPALQKRLETELSALGEAFTDAELEHIQLLNAVIDETLRLYGAAPGSLPRIVPPAGSHLDGFFLPGGTTVSTQAFTLHRQPSIFPDPEG